MNLTEFNKSDHCVYFSCPERSASPALYFFLYMCSAAVVLPTVFGNLLVIISVFHFKQLHTPTNMLVLSLAVSDFLIGAIVMPTFLIWSINSCWTFGTDFCIIFWMIGGFLMTASIYTIALISVDRYLALSNPFMYTSRIGKRTMSSVVYCKWLVCLVYNITFYYFSGTFTNVIMCPGECVVFLHEIVSVIDLVVTFIFPLSVIITLYIQVFLIAKEHTTAIRKLNHPSWTKTQKLTSHMMNAERKAAKILCILVFVFVMCLLPYFICSVLGYFIQLQSDSVYNVPIIICINSTINPFIYALFYTWFRRCFKLIITLRIFQTDSSIINVLS